MREALLLIGGGGCESFTRGHCEANGRVRGAYYGGEGWCDPCIANEALGRPRGREELDLRRRLAEDGVTSEWMDRRMAVHALRVERDRLFVPVVKWLNRLIHKIR